QDGEGDAGQDDSPASRRGPSEHSLERPLRERRPGLLRPVLGPGPGRERVRARGARAALLGSPRPALARCLTNVGERRKLNLSTGSIGKEARNEPSPPSSYGQEPEDRPTVGSPQGCLRPPVIQLRH